MQFSQLRSRLLFYKPRFSKQPMRVSPTNTRLWLTADSRRSRPIHWSSNADWGTTISVIMKLLLIRILRGRVAKVFLRIRCSLATLVEVQSTNLSKLLTQKTSECATECHDFCRHLHSLPLPFPYMLWVENRNQYLVEHLENRFTKNLLKDCVSIDWFDLKKIDLIKCRATPNAKMASSSGLIFFY